MFGVAIVKIKVSSVKWPNDPRVEPRNPVSDTAANLFVFSFFSIPCGSTFLCADINLSNFSGSVSSLSHIRYT